VSHANARLTPAGRLILVQRIAAGRPPAHMAAEMGVSRACAYKWWGRWQAEGKPGLIDRPSRARSHARRTPACTETRIRISRHLSRRGPVAIGAHLNVPASTVGRVLRRHQTPPLAACDRAIGARQKFIRPHCPWTNGKVERFNRALGTEWAYSRIFTSNDDRTALLPAWLNHYNLNRPHLGIGGRSPIDRVNNAAAQYI
jgi:hypothetical protein